MRINQLLEILNNYYSKNPKHYHTAYHITDMLAVYAHFRDAFCTDIQANTSLDWEESDNAIVEAIVWHDSALYDWGDHEHQSAMLYKVGNPNANDKVINAILNTKIVPDGDVDREDIVAKIVRDLDWSYFTEMQRLLDADTKILYELSDYYNGVFDKKAIKEGRKEFLESLIGKELFSTYTFQEYEKVAQRNIKQLIRQRYK